MPNEANFLDITLLGKEYRVACPIEEREALLEAVTFVDAKMHDIAEKTKSNIAERIAVMVALNIAHEQLSRNREACGLGKKAALGTGLDFGVVKRRITEMEARLDAVLQTQEQLL